jgi:predicted amidohydrolase
VVTDLLRVAAVQTGAIAGAVETNVAVACSWVRRAAAEDVQVVVLPELVLTGYDPPTWRSDQAYVHPHDRRLSHLAATARSAGVLALAGAAVGELGDPRRTLAMLAFLPDGAVTVAYEKQHLWDVEREHFTPGRAGADVTVGGWLVGLGICYDGCFPEHARAAADAGALAYVCPSAYVVGSEHRRDLYYAARAIDNGMYVVMAGLVGWCGDTEFSGGTAIYDPQGRPVARVAKGNGMVVADLDRAVIDEARRINPYERDRPRSLGGRTHLVVGDAAQLTTGS